MPKQLSKDDLLKAVIDFADQKGETPTAYEMDKEGPHTTYAYYKHWDSWFDVLDEAGLEPRESSVKGHVVGNKDGVSITTTNDGHRELRMRVLGERISVMIHRLHATLLVDDVDQLLGKEVHHRNGCPFDNRIENYQLLTPSEHMKSHSGVNGFKTLCRSCGVSVRVSSNVDYCPSCGTRLDTEEIEESEYISWKK